MSAGAGRWKDVAITRVDIYFLCESGSKVTAESEDRRDVEA